MKMKLVLVGLSIVALSMPWLGGQGWSLLIAFVPLLLLQQNLAEQRKVTGKRARFMPYVVLTMFLWQLICTYWIMHATLGGMIAAVVINTLLTSVVFYIYHLVWLRAPKALSYTLLVTAWVFYEYFYLHGQISWPWLTIGYGFADTTYAVQWYEYTGSLGGSLWVMIANIVTFSAWQRYFTLGAKNKKMWIVPSVVILLPLAASLIIYSTYKSDSTQTIKVQVLQPNIDPYVDKFGGMSNYEQRQILLSLADQAPQDVDYIVAPETALDDNIWENDHSQNGAINEIRTFMRNRALGAEFIVGATTYSLFSPDQKPTLTARFAPQLGGYYDAYNTAIQIDTTDRVEFYHKSQLVVGVEKMPYPKLMKSLEKHFVDLGGMYGQLGSQQDREVFTSLRDTPVGVAICYESIFGEYMSGYVRNGAQALFVITNDGWWKDTPGHRQHFSYAGLRAIELRRYIARSGNTGISGFLDDRGNVIERSRWNERTQLVQDVKLNSKLTLYAIAGDYLGRLSGYIAALALLYFVAYRFRKRNHLLND